MSHIRGTLFVENGLLKNKIFSPELNEKITFKHSKYISIKEEFKKHGIVLDTQDISPPESSRFTIYLDNIYKPKSKKNYLIVREPPIIIPKNHNLKQLQVFDKVFTWNDDIVDKKKYIKFYNQSYDFNKIKIEKYKNKKDGYVLVCSNKIAFGKGENYSLRNKVIDYFEGNNKKFELYGWGWEKKRFQSRIIEVVLNRMELLRPKNKILTNYRGTIKNKRETCSKYKFQFSIENSNSTNGYITEKIFDSFFSDTIPIYSGTPNIDNYIPNDCFINLNRFSSINELISYTESLNDNDIDLIKKNRDKFLNSKKSEIFSSEYNSRIICTNIINDI
jgi:hypothetical protein